MLEIICASSLSLLIQVCPNTKSIDLALTEKVGISNLIPENIALDGEYLAKGRAYESDYRREADRQRERYELRNRDRDHRNRDHRDRNYRDRVNRDRVNRNRNYRDADRRRREDEYVEQRRRERYYRPERYNRYYRPEEYNRYYRR